MKCPICKENLKREHDYCNNCGFSVSEQYAMVSCPSCGHKVSKFAQVCPKCNINMKIGSKLVKETETIEKLISKFENLNSYEKPKAAIRISNIIKNAKKKLENSVENAPASSQLKEILNKVEFKYQKQKEKLKDEKRASELKNNDSAKAIRMNAFKKKSKDWALKTFVLLVLFCFSILFGLVLSHYHNNLDQINSGLKYEHYHRVKDKEYELTRILPVEAVLKFLFPGLFKRIDQFYALHEMKNNFSAKTNEIILKYNEEYKLKIYIPKINFFDKKPAELILPKKIGSFITWQAIHEFYQEPKINNYVDLDFEAKTQKIKEFYLKWHELLEMPFYEMENENSKMEAMDEAKANSIAESGWQSAIDLEAEAKNEFYAGDYSSAKRLWEKSNEQFEFAMNNAIAIVNFKKDEEKRRKIVEDAERRRHLTRFKKLASVESARVPIEKKRSIAYEIAQDSSSRENWETAFEYYKLASRLQFSQQFSGKLNLTSQWKFDGNVQNEHPFYMKLKHNNVVLLKVISNSGTFKQFNLKSPNGKLYQIENNDSITIEGSGNWNIAVIGDVNGRYEIQAEVYSPSQEDQKSYPESMFKPSEAQQHETIYGSVKDKIEDFKVAAIQNGTIHYFIPQDGYGEKELDYYIYMNGMLTEFDEFKINAQKLSDIINRKITAIYAGGGEKGLFTSIALQIENWTGSGPAKILPEGRSLNQILKTAEVQKREVTIVCHSRGTMVVEAILKDNNWANENVTVYAFGCAVSGRFPVKHYYKIVNKNDNLMKDRMIDKRRLVLGLSGGHSFSDYLENLKIDNYDKSLPIGSLVR